MGQLKGKVLESKTLEQFPLLKKIHQNVYKKSFDFIKKKYARKSDELISY